MAPTGALVVPEIRGVASFVWPRASRVMSGALALILPLSDTVVLLPAASLALAVTS